jgi:hypothetical protein
MAQKVDSIFFNLYTDSLKKGTFNYINVDARYSNGTYLPLTNKELTFTASCGTFEGTSLFLDKDFKGEKVVVKAVLKSNPSVWKEITIYIKKKEEDEKLKTLDQILNEPKKKPQVTEKQKKSRN